jgi:hypothetical protein
VHSPAEAIAAKAAAIIDLRMLNSSALDVSLLHVPATFRLSAPAVGALTQLLDLLNFWSFSFLIQFQKFRIDRTAHQINR